MGSLQDELAKMRGATKPKELKKNTNRNEATSQYNSMSRKNSKGNNYSQGNNYNQNRNSQNRNSQRQNYNSALAKPTSNNASAPYNFVSLPGTIVPSPLDQNLEWTKMDEKAVREKFREFILAKGKLSGWLDLEMETVTPCFIGGNGEKFYAPNGIPVIPGSTLRGMTKNLVKIISCGAMRRNEDFYDWHLYFRDFAGRVKSFRKHYNKCMVETKDVTVTKKDGTTEIKSVGRTKASPGYLIRINGDYFVCPAQAKIIFDERKCNKGPSITMYDDGSADIFTGRMNNKKTYVRIYDPIWDEDKQIPVPKNVVEDYRADKNRNGLDLFSVAKTGAIAGGYAQRKEVDFVVPCYYTAQDEVVKHFGHGRYYRIAYEKSIGDHIPESLQKETVDFADAMFGAKFKEKELWAGRVFFDDALLMGRPELLDKNYTHPLMSPNPTSFQLYLKQDGATPKHWDEDTELRGYKLYWHQDIRDKDWEISTDDKQVSGMKEIQPLAKGSRFKGRIRFSNLNELELGALCKVFNLAENGEDIVYKIGQGKSIGMGSVRINAKLFVEDSEVRYSSLFRDDKWNVKAEELNAAKYCRAFTDYVEKFLGKNLERYNLGMRELRTIMNWKQTALPNWKEKTAMMNPTKRNDERLRNRVILKDAVSFVSERLKP